MRNILRSTSAALALASLLQAAAAEEVSTPVPASLTPEAATPLLDMVVVWLATNFDLVASFRHPALAVASPQKLAELRYGPGVPYDPGEVVAVYKDEEGMIYLGEHWDGRTPAGLSVLVHEMVHHLQNAGGTRFACPAEREVLAYRAQEGWLELFGRSLADEFGIDKTTLMLRATCAY